MPIARECPEGQKAPRGRRSRCPAGLANGGLRGRVLIFPHFSVYSRAADAKQSRGCAVVSTGLFQCCDYRLTLELQHGDDTLGLEA